MKPIQQLNSYTLLMQKILTLTGLYVAVSSIFSPFMVFSGHLLSVAIAIIIWIAGAGATHPTFFFKSPARILMLFFIAYTSITPYLYGNGVIGNKYLMLGQIFIFYFIYQYNRKHGFEKSSQFIIKGTVPFIIYVIIKTLLSPNMSRIIKSHGDTTMTLRVQGIGGYELIYFLVFISIILFFLITNRKTLGLSVKITPLLFFLFLLSITTVLFSNYFTALVMLAVSFSCILIAKKSFFQKIFFLYLGLVFIFFSQDICLYGIDKLTNLLGDGLTANRLIELKPYLMGYSKVAADDGIVKSFLDRVACLELSWITFSKHFFLGMIFSPIEQSEKILFGFGQHSHFLDTFALYGIFIGTLNFYLILHPFMARMKKNSVLFSVNLSILLSVLILFFMNNATPSIGYAIFFIYPCVYDWLLKRNIK